MSDPHTHYVVSLKRDSTRERGDELIRDHIAFLMELDRLGQLVLAGPFEDGEGGLVILRAESLAAARAVAEKDPFVTSGSATCSVRTWLLSCEENNHLGFGQAGN